MAQVIWSPKAVHQVNQIGEYISEDSPFHAKRVVAMIVRATRRLAVFPESGAVVPEFGDSSIREIHVFSYRILYRVRAEIQEVHILGVVHGRQLLDP